MTHQSSTHSTDANLMIVDAVSFSDHGRFHLDSGSLVEGTRDLRVGERIVIMAPDASEDVVEAWRSFGWTVVRRDPTRPIYKMPAIAAAIAEAKRVIFAANLAHLIGAVPPLKALNKKVVGILRDAQPMPSGLKAMLSSSRHLPEATLRLPSAIGRTGD